MPKSIGNSCLYLTSELHVDCVSYYSTCCAWTPRKACAIYEHAELLYILGDTADRILVAYHSYVEKSLVFGIFWIATDS